MNFNNLELFEDRQGNLYCQFTFGSGEQATVPYEELIHIRRHYNRDEVFGDPEGQILTEDINLLKSVKTAIINVVKNFSKLRGVIQWTGTVRPEDQEAMCRNLLIPSLGLPMAAASDHWIIVANFSSSPLIPRRLMPAR